MASYLNWYGTDKWNTIVQRFQRQLKSCTLCPHKCRVDRLKGQKGFCKAGIQPKVASWNSHHGEEPPISAFHGSGTIFFSHCTLKCLYCQNYPISQIGVGKEIIIEELGEYYLQLQKRKCHNVNFVTPTHYLPQIVKALDYAIARDFNLPLVFNSSGYELVEIIADLEGIIDIYLPDIRYSSNVYAKKYSNADNYVEYNKKTLKEMFRQVGTLQCDSYGIARKGMIIRHLVLPEHISESKKALEFIARELSPEVYISFMNQYFPAYKAMDNPPLNRKVTPNEFEEAKKWLEIYGLENGWVQG